MTTPQTGAPEWAASEATPWSNDTVARRVFDAFCLRTSVADRDLTAPPVSCSDGDRYWIATGATGAWATHDGELAIAVGLNAVGGWLFAPLDIEGMQVWVADEQVEMNYQNGLWAASATSISRLQDLSDVDLTGLVDGMVLKYDASNGFFRPAEDSATATSTFRGALLTKASDETTANYTAGVAVPWTSEVYDTDGFHDNVTNNTRITIPSGVSKVRLQAGVRIDAITADQNFHLRILKGGSDTWAGTAHTSTRAGLTSISAQIETPVIDVVAGDYFEVRLTVFSDTSITVTADRSWFAIEVIE